MRKYLLKYSLEFLVIVMGISISFFIEKRNAKDYQEELKNHPGHKIIMRLLFRGGTNNSFLTGFYENHIKTGNQLIDILNQEINH